MFKTATFAAATLVLLSVSVQAEDQPKPGIAPAAQSAQASATNQRRVPEYLNVAGFNKSVHDPMFAYAAAPDAASARKPARKPAVTSFPMPFTAWW